MLRCRSIVILALALAGCGGATRVGGSSDEAHVLTLLNPIGDIREATVYADEVARLSKGALRIRLVPSPHQGRVNFEDAAIADVRHGRTDLGWAGSRAWKGSLRALHAPLLIDSYALEQRVVEDDELVVRMLDELRPLGLVGIGVLPGPLRRPVGTKARLLAPGDFRGRPVGQQQSAVADATLRALRARPVALSVTADEPGLAGLETSMPALEAGGYDGPGSHLSANVDLWPRPLVVFANADSHAKLTGDERDVLRAAAASAAPRLVELLPESDAEIAGNLCRRARITFDSASGADLRSLRAAVEPVYRDLERDAATRFAIAAITALKRDVAAPPDGLPACERSTAPKAHARTPLDGTWRMDTKRSDAAPEFLAENWGHWIFVFDRGRFAITQENDASCTWGYGTYTVDGDRTTWRFTGGGGQAPNGAENKAGEEFSYSVSVYRDTVTLGPVMGEISPSNFDVEPWRRIGSPSRARLSRRCPPPGAALGR